MPLMKDQVFKRLREKSKKDMRGWPRSFGFSARLVCTESFWKACN